MKKKSGKKWMLISFILSLFLLFLGGTINQDEIDKKYDL